MCLPLAFVVLTMAGLGAWRWLILLSVPAVVAALILSQSRNAWLGLGVGGVAWVVLGRQRWVMVVILLGAAVLFGVAWLLDVGQIQGRIAATANPLAEGRIGIWLAAWEMFKDAPLLGQGPHVFGELYVDYLGRAALPDGYVAELGYMPWAHCIYLELLCERGVLGFGAFGLMLAAMGRRLLAARRRATTMTTHSYAVGLTASLLVFMAMGVLDLTFLKDWVTLVFWMLAALAATAPQAVTASERRASGNPPARARRQA